MLENHRPTFVAGLRVLSSTNSVSRFLYRRTRQRRSLRLVERNQVLQDTCMSFWTSNSGPASFTTTPRRGMARNMSQHRRNEEGSDYKRIKKMTAAILRGMSGALYYYCSSIDKYFINLFVVKVSSISSTYLVIISFIIDPTSIHYYCSLHHHRIVHAFFGVIPSSIIK